MSLERFLEIVNNKEYEKLKHESHNNASLFICEEYIDIYTKNNAFIRLRFNCHVKGFFKMQIIKYYSVNFFVPEKNKSIASFEVTEYDSMFKTLNEIYKSLKKEVNKELAKKYF